MAMGITIAVVILFLVRRDHLHGSYAIWWIGAAITIGLLGFFPRFFDYLAVHVGVSYPPILAVVLGFGMLLVKILTMDLERSRQERLIRRLAQRLAMLEAQGPLNLSSTASACVSIHPLPPTPSHEGEGEPGKTPSPLVAEGWGGESEQLPPGKGEREE